jgi:hypothetical protein
MRRTLFDLCDDVSRNTAATIVWLGDETGRVSKVIEGRVMYCAYLTVGLSALPEDGLLVVVLNLQKGCYHLLHRFVFVTLLIAAESGLESLHNALVSRWGCHGCVWVGAIWMGVQVKMACASGKVV